MASAKTVGRPPDAELHPDGLTGDKIEGAGVPAHAAEGSRGHPRSVWRRGSPGPARPWVLGEHLQLLLVGGVAVALGVYDWLGQFAVHLGRLPAWVPLMGVGSILLVGGSAAAIAGPEEGGVESDPSETDTEQVLVPRQEWLEFQRYRLEAEHHTSPAPLATGSPGPPTPVPAPAVPSVAPIGEAPSGSDTNWLDDAIDELQAIVRKYGSQASVDSTGRQEAESSVTAPQLSEGDRPVWSEELPTEALTPNPSQVPEERPSPKLRMAAGEGELSPAESEIWREESSPTSPVSSTPSSLPPMHEEPPVAGSIASASTPGLGPKSGPSLIPLCVGCGARLGADDEWRCEFCEMRVCSACQERSRTEGHPHLCPTCAVLLGARERP